MEVSANMETTGRTMVFQKECRIMPVDHLVRKHPKSVMKLHGRKGLIYRATLETVNGGSDDVDRAGPARSCHMSNNANAQFSHIAKS
jgi:hypothetical protein